MPHLADRRSVAVLGVPFDDVTMDEAVLVIEEKIKESRFHQVATANVDFVMHAIRDKELQEILCSCDLVVADGMPIVWAARLMGMRLRERVCGADLVPRLAELSAERGYGVYLLGAGEESSRRATERLQQAYPGLRIVGRYSPPVASLEEMDHKTILGKINRARPDILLVALGNPKQEKWLSMHRDRLDVPICMGIGGSLDFLAGAVSRAPAWMRNSGFEWLYRASQEPGRLAMRYLNDAAGLARHLPAQLALTAAQPRKPISSALQAYDIGSALVVVIGGDATAPVLSQFDDLMRRARENQRHVILDLSQAAYLGPDSLGSLVRQATWMKRRNLQLWLTGVPGHVRRVLRTARLEHAFSLSPSVADAAYRIEKAEFLLPIELAAAQSLSAEARDRVHIQFEILEEICERIRSAAATAEFSFGGLRSRTWADR